MRCNLEQMERNREKWGEPYARGSVVDALEDLALFCGWAVEEGFRVEGIAA